MRHVDKIVGGTIIHSHFLPFHPSPKVVVRDIVPPENCFAFTLL